MARKINAERRKKIHRLGVLTFFKHGLKAQHRNPRAASGGLGLGRPPDAGRKSWICSGPRLGIKVLFDTFSFKKKYDGNNIKGDDVITDREIVESYIPIAKFIAEMSGPRCEVAVHDLADIDHSIIAIENGYLTGRKIGDSLLDFDVRKMFEPEYMRQPYLVNYTGKNTVGDRVFRFSTFYIRNAMGYVIGLLNTNVDISNLLALQNAVSKELLMTADAEPERSMPGPQALAISADSLINSNFEEAMGTYGYTDPAALSKNEKLNIIAYLCERNTFALKGAVGIVAKKLCVSEPTAYRYLRSLRSHMPCAVQTETSSD